MANLTKLTSENFNNEIAEGITLVDFYADWCGPCKMIAPYIEEVSNEATGFKVAKLNVDEVSDVAIKYNVQSIPTLIVFKDGEAVNTKMGFMTKDQILELVDSAK
ncbi:thioredoxin [Mycoplasma sp. P36-A1]|uniref:thioredoxin n=1 Tax=Mycoplasma sp. P36-A1 TaxID=3252900 RepID=UPI003C2F9389